MTAWLLLLLEDIDSHGWSLLGQLRDRGISVEASLAYRTLRELERDGAVTSRWVQSDAGPQRRSYHLTAKGQRKLVALAARVAARWRQHMTFMRAHAGSHAGRTDAGDAAAESPDSSATKPSRELTAAWLLLLLESNASHGYGLRRALHERHVDPDAATVYRVLRQLDRAGWIESRWMRPATGPRRRLYRLRATGRRNRDELAGIITAISDAQAAFLHAYEDMGLRSRLD